MIYSIAATQARTQLGDLLKKVSINKDCFVLEKDGIPIAGLLNIDAFEDFLDSQSDKTKEEIKKSYKEYKKGSSISARSLIK